MNFNEWVAKGESNGAIEMNDVGVILKAASMTDWFFNPTGASKADNVISFATTVTDPVFSLSARVSVDFSSPYDAGAIYVKTGEDTWAKLAFEYSAERNPTIVSVVTRGVSDDSDGPRHISDNVWLRIYCDSKALACHFSVDGEYWSFLRWFTIPDLAVRPIEIGIGVQSPTGQGTVAAFSDLKFSTAVIENLRNGS